MDDPRAPALATIRAAHAAQSRPWDPYPTCSACTRCACYQPVAWPCDVARVLAAVDAQAARLAALDGDVISARNSALAFEGAYRDLEDAYHAQAARLAAVEAVAVRAVTWRDEHGPGSLQALSDAITAWKAQRL